MIRATLVDGSDTSGAGRGKCWCGYDRLLSLLAFLHIACCLLPLQNIGAQVVNVAANLDKPYTADFACAMDWAELVEAACITSNSASDKIIAAEVAFGSIASASFHTCL